MAETKTTKKAPAKKAPATSSEKNLKGQAVAKKAPAKTSKKEGAEYAIISTGGKQYRVSPGDSIKIEKIKGDLKEGDEITFDKVLLVDDGADAATIGAPYISGASVTGTLKKIARYKTINVIKYKQKSRYFKKNGHRQPYFEVKIDSIK